jgi:hypothetical protein
MRVFQPFVRVLLAGAAFLAPVVAPAPAHADVTPRTASSRFALDMASTTLNNTTFLAVGANNKAYIYKQNPITLSWTLEATLAPASPTSEQLFGYSVAIRADTDGTILAAIGAPGKGVEAPSGNWLKSGSVYLFRRATNTTWSQEAELGATSGTATIANAGNFFGESVAISPNAQQLAVGASYDNTQGCGGAVPSGFSGALCAGAPHPEGEGDGEVTIFRKTTTGWTQLDRLADNIGTTFGQCIGRSVAYGNLPTEPNELLIGAPGRVDGLVNSGRVYVLRQGTSSTSAFTLLQTLTTSVSGSTMGAFGHDISVDEPNGRALIGAPRSTVGATTESGRAFVFKRTTGVWAVEANLLLPSLPNTTPSAHFGGSVSAVAGRFLVGTGRRGNGLSLDPNQVFGGVERAYLYRTQDNDSTWSLLSEVRHDLQSLPVAGDKFGASVCIGTMNTPSGYYMCVGLPLRDTPTTDQGAFSVFDCGNNKAMSGFLSTNGGMGWACGVRGARAFATAPFDTPNGVDSAGSAIVLGFDGTRWFTEASLTSASLPGAGSDFFGMSGTVVNDTTLLFGATGAMNGATRTGRLFRANKNTATGAWSLQSCAVPTGMGADAEFGCDVAGMMNSAGTEFFVAVGARSQDHSGRTDAGIVTIHKGSNLLSSTPFQTLTAPSPQNFDYYGNAVAMERYSDGTIDLWVSCPGRDGTTGTDSGSLFLYRLAPAGSSFTLVQADLRIQGAKAGDFIGGSSQQFDLRGNLLAVGGTRNFSATVPNSGVVGILQRSSTGVYSVRNSIAPSTPETLFGAAVATNGTQLVIGAPFANDSIQFPVRTGRHDLYSVSSTGVSTFVSSTFQLDRLADDGYGWSAAINTGTSPATFIGSFLETSGQSASCGTVYGFVGPANPCATDFDSDGNNGATDLAAILSAWGSDGSANPALDANNDGIVDAQDIAALLSNWGACEG